MIVLAIETSCDETAVAILRDRELLDSEVASQAAQHRQFGGVVPELASRNHLQYLPNLLQLALAKAELAVDEIDAFAATSGPGLASSLLVGTSAAKGLAIGAGKPFLAINHLEGHLLSPFFGRPELVPNVSLVVSGGHTLLVQVDGLGDYTLLGRTLDDAAGEAFDKTAKLLGLGYPGGPEVEAAAVSGDPLRYNLPRSMLGSGNLDFSFSGLKTAVRYLLARVTGDGETGAYSAGKSKDSKMVADFCASFQQAVIDILREKSLQAVRQIRSDYLAVSGGVSCNQSLRENLQEACDRAGIELLMAEPWLCTDNAAMIAFAAMARLKANDVSDVTQEIDPNLALVG